MYRELAASFFVSPSTPCCMFALPYHWRELPQVSFLSRETSVCRDKTRLLPRQKYACRDKKHFCRDRHNYFCRDKLIFVATNQCLSRLNRYFVATKVCLSRQNFICHDKPFVVTKIFCRDNHKFAATQQAYFCRDNRRVLLRQKLYLWQLSPMILAASFYVSRSTPRCMFPGVS